MDATAAKQLLSPVVARQLAARGGSLWIRTSRGLSHWTNQDLINYSSGANAVIGPTVEDENGTLWVTRAGTADGTGPFVRSRALICGVMGRQMGFLRNPIPRRFVTRRESFGWLQHQPDPLETRFIPNVLLECAEVECRSTGRLCSCVQT